MVKHHFDNMRCYADIGHAGRYRTPDIMDNPIGYAGALIKFVLASTPRGGLKNPLAIARRLLQKSSSGGRQRNNMRPPVFGALAWELDSVGADLTPAQFAYLAAALPGENQQLDYRAKRIITGGVPDTPNLIVRKTGRAGARPVCWCSPRDWREPTLLASPS